MGLFKRTKPAPEIKKAPDPVRVRETQDLIKREMIKMLGHRGGPHLVALMNEETPGQDRLDGSTELGSRLSSRRGNECRGPSRLAWRVAGFDEAMPSLWIPLRDMFAGDVEEASVRIGVTENSDWVEWNLPVDASNVPSVVEDSQIWKVAR